MIYTKIIQRVKGWIGNCFCNLKFKCMTNTYKTDNSAGSHFSDKIDDIKLLSKCYNRFQLLYLSFKLQDL